MKKQEIIDLKKYTEQCNLDSYREKKIKDLEGSYDWFVKNKIKLEKEIRQLQDGWIRQESIIVNKYLKEIERLKSKLKDENRRFK